MDIKGLMDLMCKGLPAPLQEPVEIAVEIGGGVAPIAGSILNYFKFKKINKELSNLKGQIENIAQKIEDSQNEVYLKQEIFPIILNKIMNDEQEEKIKIILNGFEYIIDNEILDSDKIFHYYDVLAEMRLSEIVHLTNKYVVIMEMLKNPGKMELKLDLKMEYTAEDKEREDLERYMNNKLFRLGILEYVKERVDKPSEGISMQTSMPYQWQDPAPERYEVNTEKYKVSNFGKRFIEFFYKEE
ncbi:hypothetical protein bcgnr5372_63730 [Bacillus luti]